MAFGFPPKYIEEKLLENLTNEEAIVLAIEACKKLEWDIVYFSESGIIAHTKSSVLTTSQEVTFKIENGIIKLKSECINSELFDMGKNQKHIKSLLTAFNEIKSMLTEDNLRTIYEEIKPSFPSQEQNILNQPPPTTKEKIKNFFSVFIPSKELLITPILLDLNILLFLLMILSGVDFMAPDNISLLKWGGNYRPVTLDGEWWRLITNCFLHIGIIHLFMNMYALIYIGILLEPILGTMRFISAYLLSGIIASVASIWWHDFTISAGASGAIFGMYGVFLAILTTKLIDKKTREGLLTSISFFIGFNLLYGVKGGIDNAAHIGGLLCGIIIGYLFIPSLRKAEANNLKIGTLIIVSILVFITSFIVYKRIPNDLKKYDIGITEFFSNETRALHINELPANISKDKYLQELTDTSDFYWNKNLELIYNLDKLNLPEMIHQRNAKLIEYCKLRIKINELLYKEVIEGSSQYVDQIGEYNKQIEALINDMNKTN